MPWMTTRKKYKMKLLPLFALLALMGCKDRPNHYDVKLQNGTPGYRLDCDKTQFTTQACINEAANVCKGRTALIIDDSNNGINTIVRCQ
jgi:hypothetical protein